MNKILPSVFIISIILVSGFGCVNSSNDVIEKQAVQIEDLNKEISELKNIVSSTTIADVEEDLDIEKDKENTENNEKVDSSDSILIELLFNQDSESFVKNSDLLVNNITTEACLSKAENSISRNHIYYLVEDNIFSLENKYNKYKGEIDSITNSLNSLRVPLSYFDEKCKVLLSYDAEDKYYDELNNKMKNSECKSFLSSHIDGTHWSTEQINSVLAIKKFCEDLYPNIDL